MDEIRKELEETAPKPNRGEKRFRLRALIITAAVTLVLTLGMVALTAWLYLGPGGLAVLESMGLINHYFPGDHTPSQTSADAIRGMVAGLDDRWSSYFTKEQYEAWKSRLGNSYTGIGITYVLSEDGSALEIIEITPGGPAEAAGLLVGERVVAIDGQSLNQENIDALVGGIQERAGKDIVFTVLDADGNKRQVSLRTAQVKSRSVDAAMLESDIGYVRLENFFSGSAAAAKEAVDELVEQGARALLFDVRNDPGGYTEELTGLLDHLLPAGPIFAERRKNGPVQTTYSDDFCVDLPMAVLINADSYSAAEMFAAQLRESVGAPLIGERTFGKGYYQQTFALPDGSALHLSTGLYTTGGGVSLIGKGLIPDIVEADVEAQLERAVECLKEKLG